MKNSYKYIEIFNFLKPFLWDNLTNKFKIRLLICVTFLFFAKVATLITPIFLGKTIDSLTLINDNTNIAIVVVIGLIIAYGLAKISSLAFNEIKDSFFSSISQLATREIGMIVFKHLHSLSLDFHLKRNTGSLSRFIDRGTKGIDFLLRYVVFNILPIIIEIIFVCIIFSYLFGLTYTLVTFLTVFLYILITFKITQWRIKFRKELNSADNNVSNTIIESLINFETVKYFGNENFEFKKLNNFLKKYETFANKNRSSLSILNISQNLTIMSGIIVLLIMSSLSVQKNILTVGDFIIINTYLLQLYQPLNFLGSVYREIRQSIVDMENMFNLLKIENKKNLQVENLKSYTNFFIEFQNVNFSYEKTKTLNNLSFSIKKGEKVAFVGPTGSGKTTIFRLLFKFYDNFSGNIFIDGINIKKIPKEKISNIFGIIPQDVVLFNESIFFNINYGKLSKNNNDVINAARNSEIHDFIINLPEKYETLVGERGLKLSGGEKQRIAIARAILKDPSILLLDEASSSLDLKTELKIQKNLEKISTNRTIISIAHRLTSIQNYDKIFFLKKGKVVEYGSHKDLIKLKDYYYKMWMSQRIKS